MTRTGKIARLPRAVREELNRRLADGEPGVRLVEWLNALPEVQRALMNYFDGREINEPNLSEWKQGGFLDWEARQETLASTKELVAEAREIKAASEGALADHLSTVLAARYAELMAGWNGEVDEAFQKKLRGLRLLCQDIGILRKGDLRAERLKLEAQRYQDAKESQDGKALGLCLEESKQWLEVSDMFQRAFALMKQYRSGARDGGDYERRQRVKAEAERERVQKKRNAHLEKEKQRWMAMNPGKNPDAHGWQTELERMAFEKWRVKHPGKTFDDFLRAKVRK